jgi:hypothetical protein
VEVVGGVDRRNDMTIEVIQKKVVVEVIAVVQVIVVVY